MPVLLTLAALALASAAQAQLAKAAVLIDPANIVILLLDHQAGLFRTVKDISVAERRANAVVLAKADRLAKIPVLTAASVPDGPNGPLMPEIHQFAPHAIHVPRKARSASGTARSSWRPYARPEGRR